MEYASLVISSFSTLLALPSAIHNSLQLSDRFSGEENAEQTQECLQKGLRELEHRCLIGEAQTKSDNIPSEHQKQAVSQLFARVRSTISKALADSGRQLSSTIPSADTVLQTYSLFCNFAEDARLEALRSTYSASSSSKDREIGKIKEKLRKDQPLIASRESHIYSSTDRPPGIEFAVGAGRSPLVTLDNLQCFMEYFPFGTEFVTTKSRICWMMLLLQELRCPHVMEPLKVFSVAEGSQPGFYTCSRVRASPAMARELHTLDECVSRIHNKKKVVIHLSLAVQELHEQTILHKNICANNVLVDEFDNAWLAGLSSSRLGDQNSYKIPEEELTRVKMVYYDYDGPAGSYIRSFKCDIYALGVVMLEVALGKSFVRSTELITLRSDIFSLLDHQATAGPFKDLIYKCLAPEARSRPFASDISAALEAISAEDIDCSQS